MKKIILTTFLILLVVSLQSYSQEEVQPSNYQLSDKLPVEPDVLIGKFDNGLTYYIKENKKPENRAALWLAVNAGAVLEDDDQQGLAHFVEHMGFNGTKNFKKHELIDFLEKIGMQFGPEINAFTSFDETVYFIQVPTDSSTYLETGVKILQEWAHNVSFEDEEIDKERGVVGEEWRLGRGANMRMLDKQLPVLLHDSKYANRLPIGKKEIIDSAKYETIKRFYKDWYRPDLMAVVAVGDFNKDENLNLIEQNFASIPEVKNPKERTEYKVPDHKETLFAIATDKEADRTSLGIYYKSESMPKETLEDFKNNLMSQIYTQMLNYRLYELTKEKDPPFLYGYSGKGKFVRTKGIYYLGAMVKDNGIEKAFETLLTEANRIKEYGFTESEFERAKIEIMRSVERQFKERDKTESNRIARSFVSNYLEGEPIPSAKQELAMTKQFLPTIKLDEVNSLINKLITEDNQVVLISAPEKDSVRIPTENELRKLFDKVNSEKTEAYVDNVSDAPLLDQDLKGSKIIKEDFIKEVDVTKLELENGIKIFLKPTDFKNDEVRLNSFSLGGTSHASNDNITSAQMATQIIRQSGVGDFSQIELMKKLTGKTVSVSPFVAELYEGISAYSSPDDLETMFKLIYLYFHSPRKDSEAFENYVTRLKGSIENRKSSPERAFNDTLQVTLSNYSKRNEPWSVEKVDKINLDSAFTFYEDRFNDASDYNFFIVGNFEIDKIKPMLEKYLGSLPITNRIESWEDKQTKIPSGVVQKDVFKGVEPKSLVGIVMHGDFEKGFKPYYDLSSLVEIMRIRLREVMREDKSGTYGVQVGKSTDIYPTPEFAFNVSFGCDPARVDELVTTLFEQIDSVKTFGPKDINIEKVKEIQLRNYEENLKQNGFWISELFWKTFYGDKLSDILDYPNYVNSLTADDIKAAANNYLNTEDYVQVVLYPENLDK